MARMKQSQDKHTSNITKRGNVSSGKNKSSLGVGPVMITFFLIVVVGSSLVQIIRSAQTGQPSDIKSLIDVTRTLEGKATDWLGERVDRVVPNLDFMMTRESASSLLFHSNPRSEGIAGICIAPRTNRRCAMSLVDRGPASICCWPDGSSGQAGNWSSRPSNFAVNYSISVSKKKKKKKKKKFLWFDTTP